MIGSQPQKAIVDSLRTAALAVGQRVYDGVPGDAVLPYVQVADPQTVDTSDQCHDLFEFFINVHVWSEIQGSSVEAQNIGEAIRKRLTGEDLQIEDYAVIFLKFESANLLREEDRVTIHVVLTFRLLLQPQ